MSLEHLIHTIGAAPRLPDMDRRKFLQMVGAAAGAGILGGCAILPKDSREDVANIEWDCNPILPIPKNGCYIGTNIQVKGIVTNAAAAIGYFKIRYGVYPTFVAPGQGRLGGTNDFFPHTDVDNSHAAGVIPMIRYAIMPFEGYDPILKGDHDNQIQSFAAECAKREKPIVLTPFQHPNEPTTTHYEWGARSPSKYKATWVHMHRLFEEEGANKNTLWSIKLQAGRWRNFSYPDPFQYIPPEEYFDILGWGPNNICQPDIGLYPQSFQSLFNYYYEKAAEKYPRKIQVIWELASDAKYNQDEWYDNALTLIRTKYPRVKAVNLDENAYRRHGAHTNPVPTKKSTKKIKRHFADPYFIGNIIKPRTS